MIPKIIHLCWISGDPYPPKIKNCISSWKREMPDYKIIVWDKNRLKGLGSTWIDQCIERKAYAFAADYVRFYALYHFGGIYMDSDVEVKRSFDSFLKYRFFFGFEYMGTPEAAVIGAEKGLLWINNCLNWYRSNSYIQNDREKKIIAPLILLAGFESTYNIELVEKRGNMAIDGGIICTYDYFSSKNVYNGKLVISKNTYSIHHFNSAWLRNSIKVRISRYIHLLIISLIGRKKHNQILYNKRKNTKRKYAYE